VESTTVEACFRTKSLVVIREAKWQAGRRAGEQAGRLSELE
jgi:hypothetical protein